MRQRIDQLREVEPSARRHDVRCGGSYRGGAPGDIGEYFPAGFVPPVPTPPQAPRARRADDAAMVGVTVSYGTPFTVDPPGCRALLEPVRGQVGAVTMGIGAQGPDKGGPVIANGVAQRLTAPSIDGAVTAALRVVDLGFKFVEYFYFAILDNRTYVEIHARVDHGSQAEPALPLLLAKAVAAVRGN